MQIFQRGKKQTVQRYYTLDNDLVLFSMYSASDPEPPTVTDTMRGRRMLNTLVQQLNQYQTHKPPRPRPAPYLHKRQEPQCSELSPTQCIYDDPIITPMSVCGRRTGD
jgi:hypothetical protein